MFGVWFEIRRRENTSYSMGRTLQAVYLCAVADNIQKAGTVHRCRITRAHQRICCRLPVLQELTILSSTTDTVSVQEGIQSFVRHCALALRSPCNCPSRLFKLDRAQCKGSAAAALNTTYLDRDCPRFLPSTVSFPSLHHPT